MWSGYKRVILPDKFDCEVETIDIQCNFAISGIKMWQLWVVIFRDFSAAEDKAANGVRVGLPLLQEVSYVECT